MFLRRSRSRWAAIDSDRPASLCRLTTPRRRSLSIRRSVFCLTSSLQRQPDEKQQGQLFPETVENIYTLNAIQNSKPWVRTSMHKDKLCLFSTVNLCARLNKYKRHAGCTWCGRETVPHYSYYYMTLLMTHVIETCFFSSSRALSFLINDPKLRRSSSHTLRSSCHHGHTTTKDITRRRCVAVILFPEYRVSSKTIHPYPERLKKSMFIRGMRHLPGLECLQRCQTDDVYHTTPPYA